MQKVVRRTVVFPINPNDIQREILQETRNLFVKACGICVDAAWELEKCNGVALHKLTYQKVKSETGLKSQFICSSRNKAVEMVKSVKDRLKKGKTASKPVVKNVHIRLDARTLTINESRSEVFITTQKGRMQFPIYWHKHALRYKNWTCKAGEIGINKKGKWELRLVFETTVTKPEQTGRVVAVDMGIKKPVVTSSNKFLGKAFWKAKEEEILAHIARLQSKGSRAAKRRLKKILGRLRRFKKDCDYVLAKELMAYLKPGDILVFEILTNIRERCGKKGQANKKLRTWLNRWSFKRLLNGIVFAAEIKGVCVVYVHPHYTSQMCSRCSVICKSNRKSQSIYSCSCGCKLNADLNAARNIAHRWCIANGYTSGPPSTGLL